ncbi:hypothetical protein DM02DRAFT_592098 [Periconia macrospinosa]|uniref:Copper transport protein n=1 Tax=Periconia macrospinosa TaxID=97972 RepID=A0A2V1DRK7_9PLEO|nr:hypothetical protein DM02DRAFT_592098 [Periconia macrospinosa]
MDMTMNMDMDSQSSSATTMSGAMTNTFSTTTLVTLWFTDWTTNTPSAYAFTLIFLFALGIFNRFLAALKTQLERRWDEVESERDERSGAKEELEPLSPVPVGMRHSGEKGGNGRGKRRFWIASKPWSAKRDGARAGFEFTRAVIGYILMLAVMTYNVGFFFAVTGSVLLGELVFGRYTMVTHTGWQEGGCHE